MTASVIRMFTYQVQLADGTLFECECGCKKFMKGATRLQRRTKRSVKKSEAERATIFTCLQCGEQYEGEH